MLHLQDLFIINNCTIQCLSPVFMFINPCLDGLMLDHHGVLSVTEDTTKRGLLFDHSHWIYTKKTADADNMDVGKLVDNSGHQELKTVQMLSYICTSSAI